MNYVILREILELHLKQLIQEVANLKRKKFFKKLRFNKIKLTKS